MDVFIDYGVDSENGVFASNEIDQVKGNIDDNLESIDWDISVDSAQIDWDIGTIEETDDPGNGFGSYEMVNASEVLPSSLATEAMESDNNLSNKAEGSPHKEVCTSDTPWDISVETPQVEVTDDVTLTNVSLNSQVYASDITTPTSGVKRRSQLLETEYRNKILDDLFEVSSFFLHFHCPFRCYFE